jgi:hypothetical protein
MTLTPRTACLVAVGLGLFNAVAWILFINSVVASTPLMAALTDGAIIIPGLALKQIWMWAGAKVVVLASYLAGSVAGTYLAVAVL